MYTSITTVGAWAKWAEETGLDDRPMILCEYSHAMGNSNGSVAEYVRLFQQEPALAGGFIWDWKDQGLSEVDDRGRPFWAYGGYYGDEPNDANFCINGLVGPDGAAHPGLIEVAWAYRPVAVTQVRGRRVRVENRRAFSSLADLECRWSLLIDGRVVEAGVLTADADPGKGMLVSVPVESELPKDASAHLHFDWTTVHETDWCGAGHVVAWDEVTLRDVGTEDQSRSDDEYSPSFESRSVAEIGSVSAGMATLRWGPNGPTSIAVGGREILTGPIEPCLWRAPTDNDGVRHGWMATVSGVRPQWVSWGLDRLVVELDAIERIDGDRGPEIVFYRRLVGASTHAVSTSRFLVHGAGVDPARGVADSRVVD